MNRNRTPYSCSTFIGIALLNLLGAPAYGAASQGDLILEDVSEVSPGLPRIYFLIRKEPTAPPLMDDLDFSPCVALLDTGASAISMTEETATRLGLKVEPQARFMDAGVGGEEEFGVSKPLMLGLAGYQVQNPEDLRHYRPMGPARFKIKRGSIGLTAGVQGTIGMPALLGQVMTLDTANLQASGHVAADIRSPGDPNTPPCQFAFRLRMQSFNNIKDQRHIPPFPTLAPNPVVDQVVLEYQGKTSTATWLLDTGGRISLVSTEQARRLGLLDADGKQQVKPVSEVPIGGVGRMTTIPFYPMDRLVLPDVSGRKIIYVNVCVGIHDITYSDPQTQTPRVLDGVFGFNLLCPTKRLPGSLPLGGSSTPFDKVVIDLSKQQVGLRLKETRIQ